MSPVVDTSLLVAFSPRGCASAASLLSIVRYSDCCGFLLLLWVSAMTRRLFVCATLLLVFSYVFLTVFKSSGIPLTATAADSPIQQAFLRNGTSIARNTTSPITHAHGSLSVLV